MSNAEVLFTKLNSKYGYELTEEPIVNNRQVRFEGRVKGPIERWKSLVVILLASQKVAKWAVDISRPCRLVGNELKASWRMIFQCEEGIDAHLPHIISFVDGHQAAVPSFGGSIEVTEQILSVRGPRRTLSDGGKGASTVGPPLIVRQRANVR
jgi:hypothetical protein